MDERSAETYVAVRENRIKITAVVAAFNEVRHIGACLEGLLAQTGVDGEIEILVVDGMSTDGTAEVVRSFPQFGTKIRLLENPRRLQVFAWNEALREARGEYFAMIVAHAEYGPRYLASCLEVMRRTGADAVGGVQRPVGDEPLGRAIAWCMSSSFGIGNARFRYTRKEEETDSVFSIFTRRDTLQAIGGYDERVPFDEDSELNYRLRQAGKRIVVSPNIEVRYHVRQSLRSLGKQMYRYGYWRRFTQLKHPRAVPLRVYAPAALIAGLLLSVALAATPWRLLALIVPGAYAIFLLAATLTAAKRTGAAAWLVPAALTTMHGYYGAGWWAGLIATPSMQHRLAVRNNVTHL
jgi:succinoglycan biosynthesis protein ExoA